MTGKRYYISTFADWQRHAARFTNSHWFALNPPQGAEGNAPDRRRATSDSNSPIVLLVEGDEGAHLALEDDPAFEPLPHPLAQKPISEWARKALNSLGIPTGATTFDVAEILARFHPLLRHRVF